MFRVKIKEKINKGKSCIIQDFFSLSQKTFDSNCGAPKELRWVMYIHSLLIMNMIFMYCKDVLKYLKIKKKLCSIKRENYFKYIF